MTTKKQTTQANIDRWIEYGYDIMGVLSRLHSELYFGNDNYKIPRKEVKATLSTIYTYLVAIDNNAHINEVKIKSKPKMTISRNDRKGFMVKVQRFSYALNTWLMYLTQLEGNHQHKYYLDGETQCKYDLVWIFFYEIIGRDGIKYHKPFLI